MRRIILRWAAILTFLSLPALFFQNCAKSKLEFEDFNSTARKNEFDYGYSSKPAHYVQHLLLLEPAPNPSKKFKVRIFVGTPNGTPNVGVLKMKILDETDRLICPQQSFDLATGFKKWDVSCVPPFSFSTARVYLTLTGSAGDYEIQKTYFFH